ncbi:MAG: hypothetical protein RMJ59_01215 [Candidatus Nitrosocaldus sp.]|nr:hypothetical protein [Candidatus Nitrosocaldus sp.]MDW8274984.1 hypothetical protein [Candidatus Nitrosocaldus sp.]
MIEALIAAALAGAVTALVRGGRRGSDGEAHTHAPPPLDAHAGTADTAREKSVIMHKGIEHRIRSMADIRLRGYLNDGKISEEEYRALTGYPAKIGGYAEYGGVAGYDARGADGLGGRSSSDSMMIKEILLRLDMLHSRLGALEYRMDAGLRMGSYHAPVISAHTRHEQSSVHKGYGEHEGSGGEGRRGGRGMGMGAMRGGRRGGGGVREERIPSKRAMERRKGDGYGGDERREEGRKREDGDVLVIDTSSRDEGMGNVNREDLAVGNVGVHGLRDDHGKDDSGSMNSASAGSAGMVGGGAGYDDGSDEELESIKRQILDALARLEKGADE